MVPISTKYSKLTTDWQPNYWQYSQRFAKEDLRSSSHFGLRVHEAGLCCTLKRVGRMCIGVAFLGSYLTLVLPVAQTLSEPPTWIQFGSILFQARQGLRTRPHFLRSPKQLTCSFTWRMQAKSLSCWEASELFPQLSSRTQLPSFHYSFKAKFTRSCLPWRCQSKSPNNFQR